MAVSLNCILSVDAMHPQHSDIICGGLESMAGMN